MIDTLEYGHKCGKGQQKPKDAREREKREIKLEF